MKRPQFKALAGSLLLLAAASGTSLQAQTFIGADVGTATTPTHHGGFTNNANNTISINGGGDDIWNTGDNCFFYYTSVTGQVWEAKCRIISFTGPDYWSKAALMVRRPSGIGVAPIGSDPELCIDGTQISQQNMITPEWRATRGASSFDNGGSGVNPTYPNQWFRVGRVGSVFTFYESQNGGATWRFISSQDTATTVNAFDGTAWEDPIPVGFAVTAHNDGDPNGATAVISNLVVNPYVQATAMGVVTQIQNSVTVYQYTEASFRFAATNNAIPSDLVPTRYSWYKNNVLISTNPMGPDLTFLTTPADNAAQIYAVASVTPPAPYTSISITSAVATLTVIPPSIIYTNGLKQEFFAGAVRTDVESGSVQHGTASRVTAADIGNYGANYTIRLSGYFIPPTTAAYVFFVNSDDDGDLFLSTDSNPANKRLIAQEQVWSNPYEWLASGAAAGNPAQKRSDQFSPDGGTTVPGAAGYNLTAGNLYYIEALEHQGGGGAELQVTYQTTTEMADPNWATTFTNGVLPRLAATNNNIALVTSPYTNFTWALQPTNVNIFEGANANFFSKISTDSELSPTYQWYVGTEAYPGGTSPNLTVPSVTTTLNGAQVYVVATPAEGGSSITSSVATLSVQQAVFEAGFAKDERWDNSTRAAVENGSAGTPGYTMGVPGWEVSLDNGGQGNNFARRVSGFFVPPTNGLYVFFINSDDDSDLFLSTDNSPAHKQLIAQESGWSNPLQWQGVGGGSTVSQKRSDQWTNSVGTAPFAAGISLTAGQKYYMEQDYFQGGGGANLEATFTLFGDPAPANGAATKMVGNTIGINAVRCTYVAYTTQPANVTVPPGGFASFTAVGTTDSQLAIGQVTGGEASYTNNFVFYQWYKNGNAVPGANSSAYAISPVQPSDNGTVISCQIRALGYANNTLTPIWSNSTSATLTVSPQAVFEPGWALVEWWPTNNPSRLGVETGIAGPPANLFASPRFESAVNGEAGDNYANRVSGFFIPPATGNFVFFLSCDDDGDLFISTNNTPGGKVLVAQEIGWASSAWGWGLTGGGGDSLAQRRTDSFTDPNTGLQPYPAGIPMTGGQKYYIETVHHEGGGGDYVAITYKQFTDPDPANGTDSALFGNVIGFNAPRVPWVAFALQPQPQTVTSGGSMVTFTADGYSAPSITPGITGDPRPLFGLAPTNVTYQWYKNGSPLAGASTSSYTQTPVLPADNHSQFYVAIRTLGYADNTLTPIWSNSTTVTLTVVTDTAPPTISYVATFANSNNPAAAQYIVDVTFNKWMDPTTLSNIANYTISGVTITGVSIAANHQTVQLLVNQLPTLPLSITVNGVKDLSGNTIAASSSAPINSPELTTQDIGNPGVDPAYPSYLYADAANGYIVSAEGSDIWNAADGFNFVWEYKTNDFDVVVRQKYITHTSNWAKGGLMVRESLAAGSRNWNIINDPNAADGINAPDGSGFGANTVECNTRSTTSGTSGGWGNLAGGVPPPYPNAWVRLKRAGTILSAYRATDGMHWVQMASTDPSTNGDMTPLPSVVYVGICTTAHNNDNLSAPLPPPFLYYNTAEYANYNSSFVPLAQLSVSRSGGNLNISWSPAGGRLQSSPAVVGPNVNWQVVGSSNPASVPIGTTPQYFRVINP